MAGIVAKEISALRGTDTGAISINVDHAGLYPATPPLFTVEGKSMSELEEDGTLMQMGTDQDHGCLTKNPMYFRSWSIFPTKDPHVYFQIMGNMNPWTLLRAFDLDPEAPVKNNDEAYELIKAKLIQYSGPELEMKCMDHGFCGQICHSPQAWRDTLVGKTLAAHPLINYRREKEVVDLPKISFPPQTSSDKRPLAGIKIVDMTRVIAGAAMGAALASFGANVVRIQSPNLPDPNPLQMTLTAGKRMCGLDLNEPSDASQLWELLEEADVVIQAYRRGALERKGFGLNAVLEMANRRKKGIVYLDVSCYGPDGYYAERPGYQQIADAASGCSYVCGKAYGFEEGIAVLPPLPVADMLTGMVGVVDVMLALRDRATKGGSYYANAALTAVDTIQVIEDIGLYPPEIVKKIQDTYGFARMTPDQHVEELFFVICSAWAKAGVIQKPEFYQTFDSSPFGKEHTLLAPIVHYEDEKASPRWTSPPMPYRYHSEVCFAKQG